MGFEELDISQELKDALDSAVNSGRFPHAAIFEDEDGERLELTARAVAAALVCTGDVKPCGRCAGCIKAIAQSHADVRVFSGGETPNSFKVDTVRALRSDAYIVPNEAARKVYLLQNAHNMSAQAQNALLKVLEEPPEFVCFLLLTPDRNAFLQTVLSRCVIFSQSGGGSASQEVCGAAKRVAESVVSPGEYELLAATAVFEKDKNLLRAALPELTEIFRAALLFKSGLGEDAAYREQAELLAGNATLPALMDMLACVDDIAASLDRNENYNLLITRLCAALRRAAGR